MRPSKRAYLLICLFAVALVSLPFLFWHQTWFGRKLTDAEIETFLANADKPRQSQHALVQIGERLADGDHSARRWHAQVIRLSEHSSAELRQTVAWIMGQDREYADFQAPLRKMLEDPEPMVRRNAALALSNFGDGAARPALRAMLASASVDAPVAGVVKYRLKTGEY
ncbi:MAG: HEAT repeat domain-containing protein, partial [Bryobacteraceae bacterium]